MSSDTENTPQPNQKKGPGQVSGSTASSAEKDIDLGNRQISFKWLLLISLLMAAMIGLCFLGVEWRREVRLDKQCCDTLKIFSEIAEKYADDNNGRYPFGADALEKIVFSKLRHRRFFICPKSNKAYRWAKCQRRRSDPHHFLLCWENPRTSGHGRFSSSYNVLFVGGRVGKVNRQELLTLIALDRSKSPAIVNPTRKPRPGLDGRRRNRQNLPPSSSGDSGGRPGVPGR